MQSTCYNGARTVVAKERKLFKGGNYSRKIGIHMIPCLFKSKGVEAIFNFYLLLSLTSSESRIKEFDMNATSSILMHLLGFCTEKVGA